MHHNGQASCSPLQEEVDQEGPPKVFRMYPWQVSCYFRLWVVKAIANIVTVHALVTAYRQVFQDIFGNGR